MNISVFVTLWVAAMSSTDLTNHFMDDPLSLLKSNPDVIDVEFYTPESAKERVHDMDDLPPPTLIVQIDFDSVEKAKQMTESDELKKLFIDKKAFAKPADKIKLEILETVHFDIPGHESPPPRTAPMSFVVRYYGPTRDGGDFVDYYINHHPQIAANFPGIRNVLCYLPIGWRDRDEVTDDSLVIGNEVVFDDLESFRKALASDVYAEMGADGKKFEPSGYSSHFAMHREMVFSR
jgi:hypothetical protein